MKWQEFIIEWPVFLKFVSTSSMVSTRLHRMLMFCDCADGDVSVLWMYAIKLFILFLTYFTYFNPLTF